MVAIFNASSTLRLVLVVRSRGAMAWTSRTLQIEYGR